MYVCSLAKYGSYQELAILIFPFLFLLDEAHLDTLSSGRKHRGKPLRQGHGVRSQSWRIWQLQLL